MHRHLLAKNLFLPPDSTKNPNSYSSQKGVPYVKPFETIDCPGLHTRLDANGRPIGGNQQVYDFLISLPADKLFAENVVIVFEVLSRLTNKVGWTPEPIIEKIGWGFLKLDALGHTGGVKIDTATTAQNNERETTVNF